jgi:hypothetical protein
MLEGARTVFDAYEHVRFVKTATASWMTTACSSFIT